MTAVYQAGADIPELLTPGIVRIRANNPSPMTLEGTNTYLISYEFDETAVAGASFLEFLPLKGRREGCLVIDPGPYDPVHEEAIEQAALTLYGCPVTAIVTTHDHEDHTEGVSELARRTHAWVLGSEAVKGINEASNNIGEASRGVVGCLLRNSPQFAQVACDFLEAIGVFPVMTPGHTRYCLSFVHGKSSSLLTGDFVLGRGTSVIAYPDGRLGEYMDSLNLALRLIDDEKIARILPGHGPEVSNPGARLMELRRHRLERLAQIREAAKRCHFDAERIVDDVYGEAAVGVREAAIRSTQAQLEYLREEKSL